MGRIQTNIGLITGIPIGDTVDKLMELAARPRDLLVERTGVLEAEQVAVSELSALLLSVQYATRKLGNEDIYDRRKITSSNDNVLAATITGTPPLGNYSYTPLQMAQSQQLLSSAFRSDTDPIGAGQLTFRFGDHVQRSASLELLGGGEGFARGNIRITDRSGASAEIDLSTVQTVAEVIEAINGNGTINVTAAAHGDHIRLIDNTGQTTSNLKVEEVGGGTAAASLGLAGLDVAASQADGQDLLWLSEDVELGALNDGNGVHTNRVLADISYQLRDGTTGSIDLSPIVSGSSRVDEEFTLGEILDVINAAEPGKLEVKISSDGDRLIATDLTGGAGTFTLTAANDSGALADLGLDGTAVDGEITGRRILGGAATVLLSSLGGGNGLGPLGTITLTDRSGASDTVDLSGTGAPVETLDEVIEIINAAGVAIVAQVNEARNGIELVDTSGGSGNLIVANGDATGTADKLGIAVDADVTSVNSGDLHLQVVSHNTLLADFNGGGGVARGTLTIVDSSSNRATLNLQDTDIQTLGDVIAEINRLAVNVLAEINDTGDGIRIVDLGHGGGSLQVLEGNSTTAADLHLLGGAKQVEIAGESTQVIDGSTTYTIEIDADDSLDDLREKINNLEAGVTAAKFADGSTKPYRLALASDRAGKIGELVLDTSQLGFSFEETAHAHDALMVFGGTGGAGSGILVSSSSNTFRGLLPDATLEIKEASQQPVTITVTSSNEDLIAGLKAMVDNYNSFREKLAELTKYDPETNTASVLAGDATALRLDADMSRLVSGRFSGAESIQSLAALGIDVNDDGTLTFRTSEFKARYAEDPDAVEQFLSAEQFGLVDKFDDLIERIAGEDGSLLSQRIQTLKSKIDTNNDRVQFMDKRLEVQRERLFMDFYRMELAIGKMQSNLSIIDSIQPVQPLSVNSRR